MSATSQDQGFSHLQELASNLSEGFVTSKRKLKRPSPYEISGNAPPKFRKNSSDHIAWSNSILEAIDKEDELHKKLAAEGRIS